MTQRVITLLSDFGIEDHYVASMKGVILSICPRARLVDISHLVSPQDIRSGAYLLSCTYRDFPADTIHLAVVDPGVGTERPAMVIQTSRYFFVGPDNGIFSFILKEEPGWKAWSLENPQYRRLTVSKTFHGRDVFAPAAAHLANGTPAHSFGPPLSPHILQWSSAFLSSDELHGEVIHVDHFGNIITNITGEDIENFASKGQWIVQALNHTVRTVADTYGEQEPGTHMALIGSGNRLEIAINQGDAAKALGARPGDPVRVHLNFEPGNA